MVWERALTEDEIADLFNSGTGRSCSYVLGGAPPAASFAHIRVHDLYDNSSISGLTVYEGTLTNTTDGAGLATFFNNDGLNYTVSGGTSYFDLSGTAVQNGTIDVNILGAFPVVSAYDIEGTAVSGFNLTSPETFNTTGSTAANLLLPPNVTTDVNVSSEGYYLLESNVTTTGKDVGPHNVTGLYQTVVTINATNAYTGARLTNFTGWLYNNETGYNVSYSDDNGTATVFAINGLHTIYIDVFGYSLSGDNYDASNYTTSTYHKQFDLYSENSIDITIRKESDSTLITDNVTVVVESNTTSETHYTTSGTLFVDGLTDGAYTLTFSADNYTTREYDVTVADRSTQTLTAFLSSAPDTVTFSIIDFDTAASLSDVSVLMQRLVNSTWTTIDSKTSDVTIKVYDFAGEYVTTLMTNERMDPSSPAVMWGGTASDGTKLANGAYIVRVVASDGARTEEANLKVVIWRE